MLNTVHKLIAVLFLVWSAGELSAQTAVVEQYVATALTQNPGLQASRLLENERAIALELAAANRRVVVDLKSDYLISAGGRGIDFPVGDLFNPTYSTLNQLTGTQQFPTDLENVETRFIPSNFHDTRVEARLPLLAPLIGREVALREAQTLEAKAATAVLENEVRRQVRDLYYAWRQATEGQQIIDSSRTVLQELLRVNRVLVDNDKVTADVVYRTEAEIAALDGRAAQLLANGRIAAAALNRLLGREMTTPLDIGDGEDVLPSPAALSELRTRVRAQRPELKQLDAGTESLVRLEELQDAGRRPTLGAFVNAGAQGFLNGDFGDHPYATAGLGFSWNLYDGKKRDLQKQQTRVQREQLSSRRADALAGFEVQIYQALQRLESERAQLAAATAAARAAEATYRIIDAKYRNQQALLIEVLDARNELTTARLNENLSRFRLLQADAALKAAVGE